MAEITVVIPNYNGIRFLKGCLEAVLQQVETTPAYEVIVVDNGSTDGSRELIAQYFPTVRLEALQENTGFCHAVNVGIGKSRAKYVLLLNNDTKVKNDFVLELYREIEKREKAFSVSAKMLMWDRPELIDDAGDRYCVLGWAYGRGKGKSAAAYNHPCEIFSACGGAAIYRRSVFEEIGLFDEAHFAYLEDLDIGYRARLRGYRNYYAPSAEVVHYGSASSGSRYNEWKTGLAAANSVYVIQKNMPLIQRVLNFPFLLTGFLVKYLFFCKKRMGSVYCKGLMEGWTKSRAARGREKCVRFRMRYLHNYIAVQAQLYMNLLRILKKI